MKKKKLTAKELVKKGVPYVLIPGFLAAAALGWKTGAFEKVQNYYQMKALFPSSGVVQTVEDGDTFTLKSGVKVRLIGVNSPDKGQKGFSEASDYLTSQLSNQKVFLEYDRYQDDKYGRILAWVWIDCESTPEFLPADYMHKSGNESMPGLTENPKGCKKGKLVNEELVKNNFAEVVSYQDRGELKYESRINDLNH
jgi:endonuclease YncB( thermonuclease family)